MRSPAKTPGDISFNPHLLGHLRFVEPPHPLGGELEYPDHLAAERIECTIEVGLRGRDGAGVHRRVVVLAREACQRRVPLFAHRVDDGANPCDEGVEVGLRSLQELRPPGRVKRRELDEIDVLVHGLVHGAISFIAI